MTLGVETYREAFESIRASLPGERGTAFDAFAAKGFPTNRVEAWKYTSLRPLARQRFRPAEPDMEAAVPFLGDGPRIVLVNGFLREDLTTVPIGRWAGPNGRADAEEEPLVALNAAMAGDGYVLTIGDAWKSPSRSSMRPFRARPGRSPSRATGSRSNRTARRISSSGISGWETAPISSMA